MKKHLQLNQHHFRAFLAAVGLLAIAALNGCAGTKAQREAERYYKEYSKTHPVPPAAPAPPAGDTATALVVPPRTLRDKLLGKPAAPAYRVPAAAVVKIGKKSTVYYGAATVTAIGKKATAAVGDEATATTTGKKAGPAVINSDSATLQATGGGAAAAGAGAHAEGGATVQEAKDWKAELASPAGKLVAGVAGLVLLGTGIYAFVLWRKKKRVETLIS